MPRGRVCAPCTVSSGGWVGNRVNATARVVAGRARPGTAGVAGTGGVAAGDAFLNIATGYVGTIHFTSNDGQAVLPANYTFTGVDGGVHTFTNGVTLKTASTTTSVTATDTVSRSEEGREGKEGRTRW